ncbi:disease resistance protein RPP8-like [Salvia miltiorrhiza]|uniref:disease resistance protein RPP8-like n=1 Tax=Salvia miltiorrhiza TaxID=226208 RepID=UPI0025AC6B7F|nr:disease resistance protein RPP8-like [Salvia miltiorrhiza]
MVEAVVSTTLQLLSDLLVDKVNFLGGVEEKVELLKDELKRIQSFLKDANRKQADDDRVRNWLSEIREVAHDARDVIEIFVLKVESKRRLGRFSAFPKHLHYVNKVGIEIDSIQKRLVAIHRSRESYGIKDLGEEAESVSRSQVESRRRLPPWQNDEHLVGMGGDMQKLLRESILDEERRKGLSIAVVEGMAGIGKSTLARKIYNNVGVVGGFNCRCWAVVSSGFNARETIKQLIMQLPRSAKDQEKVRDEMKKMEKSTRDELYLREQLQEMLHGELRGKTYFIVLDDVWEKEDWESLRCAFPDEQDKPCRLLITTRNKVITKYGDYALEMNVLDLNESWQLFLNKAFIHSNHTECPEELEPIGREIVEKCNGLPLAISVVGGLLVETQTKSGWENVLDQVNSHFGTAESNISTILELSYQNLSPQLKSCFLCLACFKEDANIPTKRLVHIWVGQGLIQHEGRRTVNEIARGYLDELINRNMVQIKDLTLDNRVKNCHLHDLFRDVCLVKAKDELGFQIIMKGEEGTSSSCKPRHRVVYGNLDTLSGDHNRHLRSLFVLNADAGEVDNCVKTPFRFWKSFELLEILYLEGVGWRKFPHSFRSLIGLKYLRIRGSSSETLKIPRWFDHLGKLEVLDMRSENVELPNTTLEMARLRHFSAARVHGLTSIESWKIMHTLKYISVDDLLRCSSSPAFLAACPVRELGLFLDGESESGEMMKARASLEKMANLVKLQLLWDLSLSIEPMMIPRLARLTKLKLRGGMRRCPDPSVFPPNLSYLTLVETFMEEDPMAELGRLPKLQYLKLTGYACLDERMRVLHDGFPCLVGLSLKGMYFLRGIDVEEGGMSHLKLLRIRHCPALETRNLPEHFVASLSSA